MGTILGDLAGIIAFELAQILIIEDDEAISKLEKDYLEVNHYDVKIENSGKNVGTRHALSVWEKNNKDNKDKQ